MARDLPDSPPTVPVGFENIVQSIPHMVWVAGPDGGNVYNNPRLEAFTGLRSEVLRGQGWTTAIHPDDVASTAAAWSRAAEAGQEFSAIVRVRRHDGEYRWCSARAAPLLDDTGRLVRWIGTWTDIHDRVTAEQQVKDNHRIYQAIGESIDYGVWVCEPDGRNIYASESFLKLVGMTQEECSEFGWGKVLHPDDAERTIAAWRECVRTEGTWDIEHRFRGVDGKWHPILARGVPVRNQNGEIMCWAGINLDISRMKATEERLLDADRARNRFLAVLSHELRNPLAPIHNGVALLRRAEPGGPQAQRALDVIDRQTRQLTRLVEDILDLTRMNSGKVRLNKKVTPLTEVVRRTVEDHRELFNRNGVALQYREDADTLVEVDPARIAQVVGNLLHNAAKFTPKGGHVTVAVGKSEGRATLRVTDDGAGMDEAMLARLFEAFAQAETTLDRSQGGLGLGLALAKSMVELHGGEVRATSPGVGKGSEFEVSLPLVREPSTETAARRISSPRVQRRVVIVEDNQDGATTLRDLLELEGHRVVVAHDGQEGLDAALAGAPDVILCDIGVPTLDGYEIARRLRARGCRARLVALTGYAAPEDVKRAREAGFDDHIPKPPDPEQVLATVACGMSSE